LNLYFRGPSKPFHSDIPHPPELSLA
jgi:hypothetical protein